MLRHTTVRFAESVDSTVLDQLPGVKVLSRDDGMSVTMQVEGKMDQLVKTLATFPILDLETVRPSLEDTFLTYYASEQH